MILAADTSTTGGKFSVGGETTLLGLGMTFVILILLIACIVLVNYLIKQLGKIDFSRFKKEKPVQTAETPSSTDEAVEVQSAKIDGETLLAIESAVRTYVRESATDGKPHENVTIKSVVKK